MIAIRSVPTPPPPRPVLCSPWLVLCRPPPRPQRPIKLADFGIAHQQRVNEGLSADDIGRGYSATLSPALVNRCGDEEGGLDGHASDAWALGAVLCMLLARDATLSHSALTTDLEPQPAGGTANAAAITSVGERQRRLYRLLFPGNAVPSHLRRGSRFAPLIELAERLLRRNPAERPLPTTVVDDVNASDTLMTSLHAQGVLGWRVTARYISPSDDVREAWAVCGSVPWPLRCCIRSQLYWANVIFNAEAAWRREACTARGVAVAWAVGVWVFLLSHWGAIGPRILCATFVLALLTPGYCVWLSLVVPYLVRGDAASWSWATLILWLAHLGASLGVALGPKGERVLGFPLCAALGGALWPLWQALVTCLPAECRLPVVLGPTSVALGADAAPPTARTAHPPASRLRRRPYHTLDYPTEAALRAEVAALHELASVGGAPPACTLTVQDACEGEGPDRVYRLALTPDAEPLATLVGRPGAYDNWEAWLWLHQVAGALAHLHDRGVHHGNLSLASVLITPAGCACGGRQVRLCRFDQGQDWEGSAAFASPEKADFTAAGWGLPYDAAAADVWSLGVLVLLLVSRQSDPPTDELRRLGGKAATEDEVLACRLREVAELCGLRRQDDFYSTAEWEARSRFQPFIKLAEWALRLLPSQRPSAADAERQLTTSSPVVWRTHGAGIFRLPSLRRRWRDDLVDLVSPVALGCLPRQAVKVQVFWALTLSHEPQHAHLRWAFDRAVFYTLFLQAGALSLALSGFSWAALSGFSWAALPLMLAVPDADEVWMFASPGLVTAALLASRTKVAMVRVEVKYAGVVLVAMIARIRGVPLPAWLWPALGAVAVGRVLVVVGCALLCVRSARYMGRPPARNGLAVGEGIALERGLLSPEEHVCVVVALWGVCLRRLVPV
jgi:serine/threonine protein kinase